MGNCLMEKKGEIGIDILPPEVLELVFKELSTLNDIQSCYNTSRRWRTIITKMFKEKANVLVASGKYQGKNYDVVEIINLIDPKMKYEFIDDRTARSGATGFLLQDKPIICGGYKFKNYIILGQPDQTFETLEERECSTGLVLNENLAWIVGGLTLLDNQPTEFISLDQTPVQGPTLPPLDYLSSQAMVQVDKETIYMIYHHDTWIIDPTNDFKMEKGPPLNWPQYENLLERKLLATMKIQGDTFLVALANQWGTSVKLLNTSCPAQGWIDGPTLPYKIHSASIVSSPTGKGVVIIGSYLRSIRKDGIFEIPELDYHDASKWNELYVLVNDYERVRKIPKQERIDFIELSGDSVESLKWRRLDQMLAHRRFGHVSIPITSKVFTNLLRNVVTR